MSFYFVFKRLSVRRLLFKLIIWKCCRKTGWFFKVTSSEEIFFTTPHGTWDDTNDQNQWNKSWDALWRHVTFNESNNWVWSRQESVWQQVYEDEYYSFQKWAIYKLTSNWIVWQFIHSSLPLRSKDFIKSFFNGRSTYSYRSKYVIFLLSDGMRQFLNIKVQYCNIILKNTDGTVRLKYEHNSFTMMAS